MPGFKKNKYQPTTKGVAKKVLSQYKERVINSIADIAKLGTSFQTPTMLWEQLYTVMCTSAETATAASYIIGVAPLVQPAPEPPLLHVGPPALNAQQKQENAYLNDDYKSAKATRAVHIEKVRLAAIMVASQTKSVNTEIMIDNLKVKFAPGNTNVMVLGGVAPVWATSTDTEEVKHMMQSCYNDTIAVDADERSDKAKERFDGIAQHSSELIGQFVIRYKREVEQFNAGTGKIMSDSETSRQLIKKICQDRYSITIAAIKREEVLRSQSNDAAVRASLTGYNSPMQKIIEQLKSASPETVGGKGPRLHSYTTITGGRGRGREGGRASNRGGRGDAGRGGRGQVEDKPFYHNVTGNRKFMKDMSPQDNPVDYGMKPCYKCTNEGKPGLHFLKHHESANLFTMLQVHVDSLLANAATSTRSYVTG